MSDELPIFVEWLEFLDWLLPTTEKFPKRVRFTLCQRIDNLALDVVEDLIEARYSSNKAKALTRANLRLEKLRVLLRVSHKQKHLPSRQYEHAIKAIHGVGRMLGGWLKWQREKA